MKKFLFILSAAFAVLAVSCEKSTKITEPEEQAEKYSRTFTCVFAAPESADPDTKVSIASDGKVAWEEGDEIMIHGGTDGADRKLVTLTAEDISADGKHATFTIEGLAPYNRADVGVVSEYYAQYPASAVPTGNMYYECAFNNTNAMLMAACNEGDTFRFFNLCGVISYIVSGDFDSVVFSGKNSEEVTFTDYYQVRVRDDGSGATCNYHKPGNGFKTNTPGTSISTSVVCDGSTVNYIYLPKGVNFTDGFIFKFIKGGAIVKTVSTSTSVNVDHGKLLPLGDITSHLITYVAPSTSDHEPASWALSATDLGATATANCYVISAAGAYKIPAVKGNSTTSAGNVFGVSLLWETCNTGDEITANSVIAEVDFDNDNVYFKTPATLKPGNALIAAKDSEDQILWSWHIWIPATPYTADTFGVSTKPILSRNLGALVDTEIPATGFVDIRSVGLYYQWGRKDPFVGYKWGNPEVEVSVSGASGRAMSKVSTQMASVVESIAAPTTFVTFKGDWLATHNNALWGNGAAKTIYDPCPAGYRVPAYNSGDALWKKLTEVDGFEASVTGCWWKVGSAVLTMTGCYDYDGGISHPYDRTWLWTTQNNSNEDYGEAQYLYDNGGSWASEPGWGKRKACGVPVRCVAE